MITKTIKYENFMGEPCETTAMFHLTKTELRNMELDSDGGLLRYLQKITGEKDSRELYKLFRNLVLKSYGELAEDKSRFIKKVHGEPLSTTFEETAAYDALITSFFDNAEELVDFVIGIMPKDIQDKAKEAIEAEKKKSINVVPN